jgi:hypothetical protein
MWLLAWWTLTVNLSPGSRVVKSLDFETLMGRETETVIEYERFGTEGNPSSTSGNFRSTTLPKSFQQIC